MRRNRSWLGLEPGVMILILGSVLSSAQADPITIPGYTVTDLGAGTPTFSTDANGNGVLNAPNGQVYAFSQTPNTVLTPGQGIMSNFPQLEPPPHNPSEDDGNPAYDFSRVSSAIMNANGVVAAMNFAGTSGHENWYNEYTIQLNPNGTWGQPALVFSGSLGSDGAPEPFKVVGLSLSNEILIFNNFTNSQANEALLYNVSSHTLTDLFSLLSASNLPYYNLVPIAIDDDGRILLGASELNQTAGWTQTNLLLTPDGLSAAPLEVPAPEPASLALMLLAMAGFAWHRRRERHTETPEEIRF
jgi:hypothetical protein